MNNQENQRLTPEEYQKNTKTIDPELLTSKKNYPLALFKAMTVILYSISLVLFVYSLMSHNHQYYEAVDPVDNCYSPFSNKHVITLLFYFVAYNFSMFFVSTQKKILPPLLLTLLLVFIVIGILFNSAIFLQVSSHDTESLTRDGCGHFFSLAPLLSGIIGLYILITTMKLTITEASSRTYSNKFLNQINTFLVRNSRNPFWVLLLLFPVFLLCTLLLTLLGENYNSVVKVFVDTTTWSFSQHDHPPALDHTGHYLCTVAASGSPRIVKPIRIGQRNGRKIIVNRQLLIANAFEELIMDISPKFHHFIRTNYDKYGYNLSKKINTVHLSNVTYLLMKPLEWFFLVCLYLFCTNPEQKINRQYSE